MDKQQHTLEGALDVIGVGDGGWGYIGMPDADGRCRLQAILNQPGVSRVRVTVEVL